MSRRAAWLVLLVATSTASLASADETDRCVASSERAQQLRRTGKLYDARTELITCGRAECPKVIQQDCIEWMRELLGVLPSVVPGAKDAKGRDLVDVTLSIDGKVITDRFDGRPVPVDPGVHTFRFESSDRAPVTERVVVRQGEQNRILTVTFGEPIAKDGDGKTTRIAGYALVGAGLAAVATAVFLGLDASADARGLRSDCAPFCQQGDVDAIESRYVTTGIIAGVGGAAIVGGVVLFLLGSRAHRSASPAVGDAFSRGVRF